MIIFFHITALYIILEVWLKNIYKKKLDFLIVKEIKSRISIKLINLVTNLFLWTSRCQTQWNGYEVI